MPVNQKRGNSLKSSLKIRKVTREAFGYQMIPEEVSSERRQRSVEDVSICRRVEGKNEHKILVFTITSTQKSLLPPFDLQPNSFSLDFSLKKLAKRPLTLENKNLKLFK